MDAGSVLALEQHRMVLLIPLAEDGVIRLIDQVEIAELHNGCDHFSAEHVMVVKDQYMVGFGCFMEMSREADEPDQVEEGLEVAALEDVVEYHEFGLVAFS